MAKPDNTLKRKEREEKENAADGLKFVIDTAKLKCDLCTVPEGDLKVNFDTPTIQDKKVATVVEKDKKSLIFKGNCKKSPQSSSPCASVMKLADWKDVGTVYFQDQFPLLLKSTIKCEYGGVDIKITDSAQRNVIEKIDTTGAPVPSVEIIVNGYFYTKEGIYLGKIGTSDNVYIADESTFVEVKKGGKVSKEKIIYFTEKYGFNNEQLLYRAHWVYGEGGGFFTDYYAHAIKNLKQHGVWGPANKPYASDEAMYKQKMTHKNKKTGKIINMYPGYFNGTDGNVNSKAFSKARKKLIEVNSLVRANDAIKSVIGSIDGSLKDPTNGCYQWVGGSGTEGLLSKNPDSNNATGIVNKTNKIDNVNFYHTFYKIKKE